MSRMDAAKVSAASDKNVETFLNSTCAGPKGESHLWASKRVTDGPNSDHERRRHRVAAEFRQKAWVLRAAAIERPESGVVLTAQRNTRLTTHETYDFLHSCTGFVIESMQYLPR
ncbi:hypothetical protein PZA22_00760 [Pectobacterium polaris]|uniref:hypothetical protein n=1 Tax=Pectobacterium polaris TaxID=2042057 RepID=UPI0023B1833E|nr:hypothetical protein [Pectobacterium polaris]MDE8753040.1 hypothetical protein [Pectobacterium polaris]